MEIKPTCTEIHQQDSALIDELAKDRKRLKRAVEIINEMQLLIGQWTYVDNAVSNAIRNAFNIGAGFLTSNPDLQNEFLAEWSKTKITAGHEASVKEDK